MDTPTPLVTANRHALARAIWNASRADEGTISVTGANIVADALLASGVVRAMDRLAEDEALVGHLTYEVMNEEADLADRQPPQSAWDELDYDVRQTLRLLPRALDVANDTSEAR